MAVLLQNVAGGLLQRVFNHQAEAYNRIGFADWKSLYQAASVPWRRLVRQRRSAATRKIRRNGVYVIRQNSIDL